MCQLIYCQRKLKDDEIDTYDLLNPDGIGIGWTDRKYTYYEKGFTKNDFKIFYRNFEDIPHVVHFRLASSGGKSLKLTHPFIVSKTSPLKLSYKGKAPLLFHNGCVLNWEQLLLDLFLVNPSIKGDISDTRTVALYLGYVKKLNLLKYLNGKWILLRRSGVTMYGDFTENNGIWASNFGDLMLSKGEKKWYSQYDKYYECGGGKWTYDH